MESPLLVDPMPPPPFALSVGAMTVSRMLVMMGGGIVVVVDGGN